MVPALHLPMKLNSINTSFAQLKDTGKTFATKKHFLNGSEISWRSKRYTCAPRAHIKLTLNQVSEWRFVTRDQVEKAGGGGLFYHYRTLEDALKIIYPSYPWHIFTPRSSTTRKRKRTPAGYWEEPGKLIAALNDAEAKLKLNKVSCLFLSMYSLCAFPPPP